MVRIEDKKLIIEIETDSPLNDLSDLNVSLLSVIASLDSNLMRKDDIFNVAEFIKHIQPTYDQLKLAYEATF